MRPTWRHLGRFAKASRGIPTTDLYFANACRDWLIGRSGRPTIKRVGANSFVAGRDAVVCRRDTPRVIDALLADRDLRITYIIDDDVAAGASDASLPADYRARLKQFCDGQHAAMMARAETIVVPTPMLREKLSRHADTALLDPHWSEPFADGRHFDEVESGGQIRIAYLGSVTHGADRAFVFDVLQRVLAENPRVVVTLIGSGKLAHPLGAHPRVHLRRPLPWPLHRLRYARLRFHLALYPIIDTPFNRARSLNKVIEHAVVGAVGLYSSDWTFAERIRDGETGLLVHPGLDAWERAINEAVSNPARLRRIQAAARERTLALNDPARQRRFWSETLSLPL